MSASRPASRSDVAPGEVRPRRPVAVIRRWRRIALAATVAAAGALATATPSPAAHPNALWHVVHDLCVPLRRATGLAAPCLAVDLRGGTAVVPDPQSATQVLLVPTRRVTGIEDPALLAPDAPNYWRAAWSARRFLERRARRPVPRDAVGMAVNSFYGRSQEQLHIHIDCVRPDVRAQLLAAAPRLSPREWRLLSVGGSLWRVRELPGEDLAQTDPFALLAAAGAHTAAHMERQTLAVIGGRMADGGPGFHLLAQTARPSLGLPGHGEILLDQQCDVLRAGANGPSPDPG